MKLTFPYLHVGFHSNHSNQIVRVACSLAVALGYSTAHCEDLAKGFANPPPSARAHTWWHWMNGNITKEGITADLEAMARVGVGGAQIFNAAEGIPHGPVQFNSPEWRALVKHAATEADRLGLEICIHNCAGWSSSGGPWNTPEHGMQVVVTSETQVDGPQRFDGTLPRPKAKLDYYRDIAVLAFRTVAAESVRMSDFSPKVTTSVDGANGAKLIDGNPASSIAFQIPTGAHTQFIQIEFARPFRGRTLTLTPVGGMRGCNGRVEVSDDGSQFRSVRQIALGQGVEKWSFLLPPVTARYYRIVFTGANSHMKRLSFGEVEISPRLGIENLPGKAFYERSGDVAASGGPADASEIIKHDEIVDLSTKMDGNGHLTWDVPAGKWTIVRFGHTPTGRTNHPAPTEGTGLECDKLSAEAAQAHWDGSMGKLIADLGPLVGKSFNNVLIDSYEVGTQNWTPKFREESQKRRGYNPIRFLPILTGRIVDSTEITNRFLWDFRRTISDLFAENYSAKFAEMAHKNGMLYSVEPYGNSPSDDLQYGSYGDIPMAEFWPGNSGPGNSKHAAALGHVYGRKFVGAESFTAAPEAGKWTGDPFSMKAQGDRVWCAGVNRFIFHRYAHQPWTNPTRFPGMTMGQWGTHFERSVTWWEQGRAWLTYIARSQYLLQSGRFVGDVLFFTGEGAPNDGHAGSVPAGYDYDTCCTDALLNLASVKDGRLVFPSGMTYRVLALPNSTTATPALLRKLKELVQAGATVVGKMPEQSPSLTGWPQCDDEVRKLADELWAKGIQDKSPADALTALGVKPDFSVAPSTDSISWIHRTTGDTEIYLVANHSDSTSEGVCTFRVAGKRPELWHADTGIMEPAPVFSEQGGLTSMPLRLDPAESVFVIFRNSSAGDHLVSAKQNHPGIVSRAQPAELKIIKAEYGAFESPEKDFIDITRKVRAMVKTGIRRFQALNDLAGSDPAPNEVKELRIDYIADGDHKSVSAAERAWLELPQGAEIVRAVYGLVDDRTAPPPLACVDLTAKLNGLLRDGRLTVTADNKLAGHDPAGNQLKELRIEYSCGGIHKTVRIPENKAAAIPEDTKVTVEPNAFDLAIAQNGESQITAWQPVSVEMTTAVGKTLRAVAQAVPAPVALSGPWELAFPPNWGAPATVTLEKLMSWTDHANPGVKYFSGTAVYRKKFDWKKSSGTGQAKIYLDLGLVKNLAEIKLNGRDLGILWKPPFRAEITDALVAGANELEVRITNLWPNRLIGDERLPLDREWDGIHLKAWPQWLLDGKPSPTGRFTFTTWHHWTESDEPLASGLLGPVLLRTAVVIPAR